MTNLSAQIESYLVSHVFPAQSREMLQRVHEGREGYYEILAPWEICRNAPEVLPFDQELLELSFCGLPFHSFPMRDEVIGLLERHGVQVNDGFFAAHKLYLETSLSYEQISQDGSDGIHNMLFELATKVGAKVFMRLSAASPIIRVLQMESRGDAADKAGAIEYTRACAEAILGTGSTDYWNGGLRVAVAPDYGEEIAARLAPHDIKAALQIVEKEGLETSIALERAMHLNQGAAISEIPPFVSAAFGPEGTLPILAVNPDNFFMRLNKFVNIAPSRHEKSLKIRDCWATGQIHALHDDAWKFESHKDGLTITLARPDPSFHVPLGGVVDTVASMIRKNHYSSGGRPILSMLPPDLARSHLSLSRLEARPSLALRVKLSFDGQIEDVSLEAALVRIDRVIEDTGTFPLDESAEKVLKALQLRYKRERNQIMGVHDVIDACICLSQEAACVYAEKNGLPILYQHRILKKRAERLASLARFGDKLEPRTAQAITDNIENDEYLIELIRQSPLNVGGYLEALLCCGVTYSPVRPHSSSLLYDAVRGSFGPPLRQYVSMITIMLWSKALREGIVTGIKTKETPSVLRDILLAGVFRGDSVFDPKQYDVTDNSVLFLKVAGTPRMTVQDLSSGTRIKGICRERGRLVLG